MSHKEPTFSHIAKLMIKPILITILIILVLGGVFAVLVIVSAPKVNYSVKDTDCSAKQLARYNLNRCNIVITAQNPTDKAQFIDWNGIGGGPAPWSPMVRVYTSDGKYCFAGVGEVSHIEPRQSVDLAVTCSANDVKKNDYDKKADGHPSYVYIDGHYFLDGTKLLLTPTY